MELAEWAFGNGVHPQAACRWFREGRMPVPARRLVSGTIWVDSAPSAGSGRVVYARVSSHGQRQDLDRQVARLTGWAAANGHAAGEVVTGSGSGLKGKRPELRRVLPGPSAGVVVVERRDWLAGFGTEHLEAGLRAQGREIVVAGPGEIAGDLVRDMTGVLTPVCARLYGRRGAGNRAMRAVAAAKHGPGREAGR